MSTPLSSRENAERWYCPRCAIVRDAPEPAPWCRHGDPQIVAERMIPIKSYHPLATGSLPWEADRG